MDDLLDIFWICARRQRYVVATPATNHIKSLPYRKIEGPSHLRNIYEGHDTDCDDDHGHDPKWWSWHWFWSWQPLTTIFRKMATTLNRPISRDLGFLPFQFTASPVIASTCYDWKKIVLIWYFHSVIWMMIWNILHCQPSFQEMQAIASWNYTLTHDREVVPPINS